MRNVRKIYSFVIVLRFIKNLTFNFFNYYDDLIWNGVCIIDNLDFL